MAKPSDFIDQYGDLALALSQRVGVAPEVLLGQFGLETGWGKSVIPGTNNLGNIKDFSGGGTAAVDNMLGTTDRYRNFDSPEAFADHYAGLLERKYPNAIGTGADALAFAQALKEGGYAEDPNYVNKIAQVTQTVRNQPNFMERIANAVIPSAQAASVPANPTPWRQVMESEQFKSLSPEQQLLAQQQYFDQVVAPRIPEGAMEQARSQFFGQYSLAPANPAIPAVTDQELQQTNQTASTENGVSLRGLRAPIDVGAQLLRRSVPDGVGQAVDDFGNLLADIGVPISNSTGIDGIDALVNSGRPESSTENGFLRGLGESILDIPRQVGLTARYGLEGASQAAGVFTEPVRQGLNLGLNALGLPEAASTGDVGAYLADTLGLPTPQTSSERVVGDAARLMAGSGGIVGGARALSGAAGPTLQAALSGLSSNPAAQIASSAGAGISGGAVREAGGGPVEQGIASLAGALVAPAGLSAAKSVYSRAKGVASSLSPRTVERTLNSALSQAGVDPSSLPANVRRQLQIDASKALRSGAEIDPSAAARLADFRAIPGATPTRGMISQDPSTITREMNLAKQQASLGAGGRSLANVQAENNASLVSALNRLASTSDDAISSGQSAISSLERRLANQKAEVNTLYSMAKDSAGRSFPLDGYTFTQRASQLLDDNLVGGALPADVRNHLNRIAQGEVPFTVDYAEQLKTIIGRLQRGSSDGSARYALGLVRQALDDTPVLPLGSQASPIAARSVNPGNLPAIPGDTSIGADAIAAFNSARSSNRAMMAQIERTPALKDLYDGKISPDNFLNKYIISPSASTSDATRLGRILSADPAAKESVKTGLIQHLKSKALSGIPDDIGAAKFSPSQFSRELSKIGDRKLAAFFTPEEIQQLHSIDRVARLMTNQPVGSAVNNSNTASALIGSALDMMGRFGKGLKIMGIGDQIGAIQSGIAQGSAKNITPALRSSTTPAGGAIPRAGLYGGIYSSNQE